MKTQTIQEIKEQVTQIQEALKEFSVAAHREERYGNEQEYTPRSLKSGIKEILTDIRGLVKAHEKFVAVSTHDERINILSSLVGLEERIANQDYDNAAVNLDALKTIIRGYNAKASSETQEVLEERIRQLNQLCSTLEENLVEIEKIGEESRQAHAKIQSSEEKIETIDDTITGLQNKTAEVENLYDQSQQNQQEIENLLTSVKSSEGVIKSFSQQIEKREQQLDQQQASTTSYEVKLQEYTEKREKVIEETDKLIEEARNALGYKTAEGISAAIYERYIEEKENFWRPALWLSLAGLCLAGGIAIGIWLVLGKDTADLGLVLGRIAVMSAAISGAWFCATQYVKYKNILEDYGYKSVLAKSIVAFLDLLTGEERERYLEIVLLEIHKDPLRKRHDVDEGIMQRIFRKKEEIADD